MNSCQCLLPTFFYSMFTFKMWAWENYILILYVTSLSTINGASLLVCGLSFFKKRSFLISFSIDKKSQDLKIKMFTLHLPSSGLSLYLY
jgi:hypothetical protein